MFILKLIGALIALGLLALATFVGDMVWNDGRLFYTAMGRDTLVDLCTPPVRDDLEHRGFSPADLAFSDHPSIAFASGSLGRIRRLSSPFTFSDGPNGPRIDGRLVCVVEGRTVKVNVDVDGLPMRAV